MDLTYDEQQRAIKTTARDFFADNCSMETVRELEGKSPGYSQELWRQMADLGWLGITFPEQYGGLGGGFLDLYVLYEEMGRTLAPSPHLTSVVLSGETILGAGSDAQKSRFLPAISSGEIIVTSALLEPNGAYGPEGVELQATADGDGFRLSGTKLLVPYGDVADYLLVAARTKQSNDPTNGVTWFLVDRGDSSVSTEGILNISAENLCAVTLDNTRVAKDAVVGAVDGGWKAYAPVQTMASVLRCAEIVGAGERVTDMAANYARERVQFGRPIGQFQAVQYLCTDVDIETARTSLLAKQAAWRIDGGLDHEREAALASAAARKAIMHLTRQAHEVFAGVAFMLEHDMQMYTRRAKSWELNLGDADYHKERWAVAMGL